MIQQAVEEKLARFDRSRLARECAKLDPRPSRLRLMRVSDATSANGPNIEQSPAATCKQSTNHASARRYDSR